MNYTTIDQCLASYRRACALKQVHGLSWTAVAERMGISFAQLFAIRRRAESHLNLEKTGT